MKIHLFFKKSGFPIHLFSKEIFLCFFQVKENQVLAPRICYQLIFSLVSFLLEGASFDDAAVALLRSYYQMLLKKVFKNTLLSEIQLEMAIL